MGKALEGIDVSQRASLEDTVDNEVSTDSRKFKRIVIDV